MKRESGFTLNELLIVTLLTTTLGLAAYQAIDRVCAEERQSRAYTQDVTKLRRAVRTARHELRNGSTVEDLKARLEGEVETIEIETRGPFADVRLVQGGEIRFTVRMRNAGRKR